MKYKKVILLPFLSLCLGADKLPPSTGSLNSVNALIKVDGSKNDSLEMEIKCSTNGNCEIVSKLFNNKTNTLLFASTFNDYVTYHGTKFTIDYPLRYRISSDGLRFTFQTKFNNNPSKIISGVIYPYVNTTINAIYYKNDVYSTNNAFIKIDSSKVITGENYSFKNFNEYISRHENNYLDFSSISFNYLHDYPFNYLKAEYHIKDYHNVFPDLYKENGEVILNMNCINNNGEISLSLNEEMYVNKTSLEMSSVKLPNYVATNELYIPVGKEQLFEKDESYILITEAGFSAINIMFPLTFFSSRKMIGLCYNSDYCIEGGVRE